MRKNQQSSKSLRFYVSVLMVLVVLFGVPASAISTRVVLAQAITPTGNLVTYLPLITTEQPIPIGPIGGTFTSFAIDPGQNDNIYAGHFGSGVYKTFDQGTTWYRKSLGLGNLVIQSLATHPTNSSIVFAGTYGGGIYRSTNAGESWQTSSGGVLNNHIIYDIEIDQVNPRRIFVVSRISGSLVGYLSRSMDGGITWSILLTGDSFPTPDYFYDVDIDPNNSNIIYLTAHEHGFFKSVNGGLSFSAINNGVTDLSARSFAIDNDYGGLVYGGVWHGDGVYRTWNGGLTWSNSSSGLPLGVRIGRLYLDPFGRLQKRVFSCTYGNGLYSSDDFAASWISRGLAGQGIYDFVIADGSPQRWYAATENNGIFRSSTYGSDWKSIMADLRLTDITGLIELPGDPNALAGSVYGQGVFRISASGENWEPMNEGLTNLDVVSIAVANNTLYAIGRGWMSVWDGEVWQAIELPDADLKAVDAGINWVRERVLLPDEAFEMITGSKVQPTGVVWQDGQLILRTVGAGVWVQQANGWKQVALTTAEEIELSNAGLERLPVALEKSNLGELTFATSTSDSCLQAVSEQTRIWITRDCGENWTAHSLDWTVQALAFDPLNADILLVGTRESGAFKIHIP